jgi:alpha-L-rhamnosidase
MQYERMNARNFQFKIELPANMVGEFKMDVPPENIILLNGQPVNLLFGSVRLSPGVNNIDIRMNTF